MKTSLLIFVIAFLIWSLPVHAQEETFMFDLNSGKFDKEKLPYVTTMRIIGLPVKGSTDIDAIELTVYQLFVKKKKELKVLRSDLTDERKTSLTITRAKEILTKSLKDLKDSPGDPTRQAIKNTLSINDIKIKKATFRIGGEDPFTDDAKLKSALEKKLEEVEWDIKTSSAKLQKLKADSVILEDASSSGRAVFFKDIWTHSTTSKEFSFSLGKRLEMGEDYRFEFRIFNLNKDAFPIDRLRVKIVNRIDSILTKRLSYEIADLEKDVEKTIRYFEREQFSLAFSLDVKGKQLSPGFTLPPNRIAELSRHIAVYAAAKSNVVEDSVNIFQTDSAANALLKTNSMRFFALPADTVKKINDSLFVKYNALAAGNILTRNGFPADTIRLIVTQLNSKKNAIALKQTDAKVAGDALSETKKAFDFVKTVFIAEGNVSNTATTIGTGEAEVEGINFGTTYGAGTVWLNDKYFEVFRFIGITYRFGDFDNRLPKNEAFESGWSRVSMLLAIAAGSDMYYRGQKLLDTRLGVKPIIGLDYKISKHLDLGIGTIGFMPETVDNTRRTVKFRPFISFSVDFNVFNYLIQKQ